MTNGKSPGSDGYTVDFYKKNWEDIGPLLYRSLYLAYESGSFTDFQYQGVITCILKEGKDRHFIGNWRPFVLICLVCFNYKHVRLHIKRERR
jgi:hypothetical protein